MSTSFDQKAKEWDQHTYRVERAKIVATGLAERVILAGKNVLDFGCGTGLLGFELIGKGGQVTFGDTSPGMLEQVTSKIQGQMKSARVRNLATEGLGGPYDVIASLMTLHHIDDYRAQIRDLARCLTVGGNLCLCDLDLEDGSFHTEEQVPHNGFDRVDIEDCLREAGLVVSSSTTPFVNRKMVNDRERLFPVFMILAHPPR